jgi:hypothetical protein
MDPGRAVAPLAGLEDLPNRARQDRTPGSALGSEGIAALPGVKPAARHAEGPAHQAHGMLSHMGGDKRKLCAHGFAAHCAKKAEALRKTSTSSFRRLLSWRSRASSAASAC